MRLILLCFVGFVLIGCSRNSAEIPTLPPTALIASAAVKTNTPSPTQTVEPTFTHTARPTITNEPTATLTSTPRVTPVPTSTRRPPTLTVPATSSPTKTPAPTATLFGTNSISAVTISSLNQAAYIFDHDLYVETSAGSGQFELVQTEVAKAYWSPNGELLLTSEQRFERGPIYGEFRLWNRQTRTSQAIMTLVPDLITYAPNNRYHILGIHWRPDSSGFVFKDSTEIQYASFQFGTLTQILEFSPFRETVRIVRQDMIVAENFCGTPCNQYTSFGYDGELRWDERWLNRGMNGVSADNETIVIGGNFDPTQQYDGLPIFMMDVETGEQTLVLIVTDIDYVPPYVSADAQYFTLSVGDGAAFPPLHTTQGTRIIRRDGAEMGIFLDAYVVNWRPDPNGLVMEKYEENGQRSLLYWEGEKPLRTFVSSSDFEFPTSKWSHDGTYFAYHAVDVAQDASYIYLWQPENGPPELIHSFAGAEHNVRFEWETDESGIYFHYGQSELWHFEIAPQALQSIDLPN